MGQPVKNDVSLLMEQRMEQRKLHQLNLRKDWGRYIGAIETYRKNRGESLLDECTKDNLAQVLENAMQYTMGSNGQILETTTAGNIAFLGIQLKVITALLPSLVLNDIANVQALDRRQGAVFYLDVKTGQAKGDLAINSTLIGAKTGHLDTTSAQQYAMSIVTNETVGAAGSTAYALVTAAYKPIIAGTMVITDGVETFTDDGLGHLVTNLTAGSNGTIDYTTGIYSVTFHSTTTTAPKASYQYNYELASNGVPQVNINLTAETLTAIDFKLKALYSLAAAMDLEKAHGLNLESEIIKFLGGEIKHEIDHYGVNLMYQASKGALAADPVGAWDASVGLGQEWVWKKYQFIDRIILGSNNIFAKTLRGVASFILCGNNVARVIRQLKPDFVEDKIPAVPTGPHKIGTLNGLTVVQDPFLPTNEYTLGFKGDSYLYAGFLLAPYIPLLATPTLVTGDTIAQKGFMSSMAYKVINPGLFTFGSVSNL